jgi:hypothetical protein
MLKAGGLGWLALNEKYVGHQMLGHVAIVRRRISIRKRGSRYWESSWSSIREKADVMR